MVQRGLRAVPEPIRRGEQLLPELDDRRQIHRQPRYFAVVHTPEAGLQPLRQRYDGRTGVTGQVVAGDLVEHQGPQCGGLMRAAEILVVVIEAVAQRDRHRVVDDAVGAGGLGGALVQREERGFGYAVEMAGVDDWHGATVRPPIGWLSKPVAKITRRAVPR